MSQLNVNEIQHSTGAGNNIVLSAEGDTQINSLNGNQLAGQRNQLINGNFLVWARGDGPWNANREYTADRWLKNGGDGNNFTKYTTTANLPEEFSAGIRCVSNGGGCLQAVELPVAGVAGPFVQNSKWTLSVWSDVNISGTTPAGRFNGGGSAVRDVTRSAFVATGETSNSFARYSSLIDIGSVTPAGAHTQFEISLTSHATLNRTCVYTGAQLEPGLVSTPFEHLQPQTVVAQCQRYFVRVYIGNRVVSEGLGSIITAAGFDGNIYPYVNYLPPMRNVGAATNLTADITNLEAVTRNNTTTGGSTVREASVRLRGEGGAYQISLGCNDAPASATFFVGIGGNYSVSAEL